MDSYSGMPKTIPGFKCPKCGKETVIKQPSTSVNYEWHICLNNQENKKCKWKEVVPVPTPPAP